MKSGSINQSKWQKEIYRIGTSLLGRKYEMGVEVSRGFVDMNSAGSSDEEDEEDEEEKKFQIPGKIDFYINSNRQWALELLVRGDLKAMGPKPKNELREHYDRFIIGKYKYLPKKEWLIVDFRPLKYNHSKNDVDPKNPKEKYLANVWIVFYPEDGSQITIVKYGDDKKLVGDPETIRLFSTQ